MKTISKLFAALLVAAWLSAATFAQHAPPAEPWTEKTLELAGRLIVQDGGRLKPLSTLANFTLLGISGKRSYIDAAGERHGAIEFVLDTLYRPENLADVRVFLINDSAVVQALQLELPERKKRDRYSFRELEPGLPRLFSLAHTYDALDPKQRDSVQQEVVLLGERIETFLRLNRHAATALIPPDDDASGEAATLWIAPADAFERLQRGDKPSAARQRVFTALNALGDARGEPALFETRLGELAGVLGSFTAVRAASATAALEGRYYRLDPLSWSLCLFVAAFLTSALTWLRPTWKRVHRFSVALTAAGALALVIAIVLRCMIRGRPPVSTLYETVLFVTAVVALVALALEWIDRKRVASAVAAFAGMVGLFIANGYETLDAKDTMPSLVAVLDTNFWLATHVTAITIGYSAGMLAALLGSVYVLVKAVRPSRATPETYRSLGRMVYGVLCFGLIFSTVGTILGGIWANESWGRFWGWDPKENGALLIVIAQLVILHARMGGYLREFGVAIAAAAAGCVVAFSWWGVNLLGVGLHSYGFTSGIQSALTTYYLLQGGVVLLGAGILLREKRQRPAAKPSTADALPRSEDPGERRQAA